MAKSSKSKSSSRSSQPKFRKWQALPMRCSYLDTEELLDRRLEFYRSEEDFELEMSNDRLILWSAKELSKEQLKSLREDRTVYPHYAVAGDGYYADPGPSNHA